MKYCWKCKSSPIFFYPYFKRNSWFSLILLDFSLIVCAVYVVYSIPLQLKFFWNQDVSRATMRCSMFKQKFYLPLYYWVVFKFNNFIFKPPYSLYFAESQTKTKILRRRKRNCGLHPLLPQYPAYLNPQALLIIPSNPQLLQ